MMHSRYLASRSIGQCVRRWLSGAGVIIFNLACQSAGLAAPNPMVAMVDDRQNADRLLIVDCLLPGQVRQLGTGVAYNRSNYSTALKVWLPTAQSGDKVAQTNVGEIYEKGLGTAPDYASAALWYQKAADQGYARALIN